MSPFARRVGPVTSAGMNPPRVTTEGYAQFLLATLRARTGTGAA